MNGTGYHLPERVREIQSFTFAVEEYTFGKYVTLLSTIPDGLNDSQLASQLRDYISDTVEYAVNTYTTGERSADFNGDGFADISDALVVTNHFNLHTRDPDWNPRVDLNYDGVIGMFDALVFSNHFCTRPT